MRKLALAADVSRDTVVRFERGDGLKAITVNQFRMRSKGPAFSSLTQIMADRARDCRGSAVGGTPGSPFDRRGILILTVVPPTTQPPPFSTAKSSAKTTGVAARLRENAQFRMGRGVLRSRRATVFSL